MAVVALIGAQLDENLSLLYLDSALEGAGHRSVRFAFDSRADTDSVARRVAALQPELVGLSMVFTVRAREFADLASRLRRHGYRGHITCGGHFATFNAGRLLQAVKEIDSVVLGEGEGALVDLVQGLGAPHRVPGLAHRDHDGRVQMPQRSRHPQALDDLPWPTRGDTQTTHMGLPTANVLSSRGCYGKCTYCSIKAWHRVLGTGFRVRSVADVANEMAHLFHDRGVRIFNFHDDNFFLPREQDAIDRFHALAHELEKREVANIGTAVKARPDSVSPAVVDALRPLGLFRFFLGIENASATGLAALGRQNSARYNRQALGLARQSHLHVCFNLLLFNPWTTFDEVSENLDFMSRYRDFPLNFCRTEVYEGTPLSAALQREGRLLGDWWGYDYLIEDRRVEAVFAVFNRSFRQRVFALDGLHHLAMRIDYFRQLLRHFFPGGPVAELERSAHEFVVAVNTDTLEHLSRAVDWGRSLPTIPTDSLVKEFAQDLSRRIERSRPGLEERGLELVARIENAAMAPPDRRPAARRIAGKAAAAAAAVILLESGMTACTRSGDGPQPAPQATATPYPLPRILTDEDVTTPATSETADILRANFNAVSRPKWDELWRKWSNTVERPPIRLRVGLLVSPDGRVVGVRFIAPRSLPEGLTQLVRDFLAEIKLPSPGDQVELELDIVEFPVQMFELVARPPVGRDQE